MFMFNQHESGHPPASPNLNCIENVYWAVVGLRCHLGVWLQPRSACKACADRPPGLPASLRCNGWSHTAVSRVPVCNSAWIGLDPVANSARSACGLLTTTPAVNSLPDGHVSPLGLIASFYRRLRLSVGVVPSWAPPTVPLRLCLFLWTDRVHPHGHGLVAGLST